MFTKYWIWRFKDCYLPLSAPKFNWKRREISNVFAFGAVLIWFEWLKVTGNYKCASLPVSCGKKFLDVPRAIFAWPLAVHTKFSQKKSNSTSILLSDKDWNWCEKCTKTRPRSRPPVQIRPTKKSISTQTHFTTVFLGMTYTHPSLSTTKVNFFQVSVDWQSYGLFVQFDVSSTSHS